MMFYYERKFCHSKSLPIINAPESTTLLGIICILLDYPCFRNVDAVVLTFQSLLLVVLEH